MPYLDSFIEGNHLCQEKELTADPLLQGIGAGDMGDAFSGGYPFESNFVTQPLPVAVAVTVSGNGNGNGASLPSQYADYGEESRFPNPYIGVGVSEGYGYYGSHIEEVPVSLPPPPPPPPPPVPVQLQHHFSRPYSYPCDSLPVVEVTGSLPSFKDIAQNASTNHNYNYNYKNVRLSLNQQDDNSKIIVESGKSYRSLRTPSTGTSSPPDPPSRFLSSDAININIGKRAKSTGSDEEFPSDSFLFLSDPHETQPQATPTALELYKTALPEYCSLSDQSALNDYNSSNQTLTDNGDEWRRKPVPLWTIEDTQSWILNALKTEMHLDEYSIGLFPLYNFKDGVSFGRLTEDQMRKLVGKVEKADRDWGSHLYRVFQKYKKSRETARSRAQRSPLSSGDSCSDCEVYHNKIGNKPSRQPSHSHSHSHPSQSSKSKRPIEKANSSVFYSSQTQTQRSGSSGESAQTSSTSTAANSSPRLWQFFCDCLKTPELDKCIKKFGKQEGRFEIMDTTRIARLWGFVKGSDNMDYSKMARGIRYGIKAGYFRRPTDRPDKMLIFCEEKEKLDWRSRIESTENCVTPFLDKIDL